VKFILGVLIGVWLENQFQKEHGKSIVDVIRGAMAQEPPKPYLHKIK